MGSEVIVQALILSLFGFAAGLSALTPNDENGRDDVEKENCSEGNGANEKENLEIVLVFAR